MAMIFWTKSPTWALGLNQPIIEIGAQRRISKLIIYWIYSQRGIVAKNGARGIEPRTSHMRSEHSTSELQPLLLKIGNKIIVYQKQDRTTMTPCDIVWFSHKIRHLFSHSTLRVAQTELQHLNSFWIQWHFFTIPGVHHALVVDSDQLKTKWKRALTFKEDGGSVSIKGHSDRPSVKIILHRIISVVWSTSFSPETWTRWTRRDWTSRDDWL